MENSTLNLPLESALRRGIKAVGVGKKGSRSLNRDLALEILAQFKIGRFREAERAAFFTGLFIKGLTEDEKLLSEILPEGALSDATKLSNILCHDAPEFIKNICAHLLESKNLDGESAYKLGKFLMSDQKGDGARALAAIALRVRYETAQEYLSILKALQETINPHFQGPIPAGEPLIQMAEPFDGVDHNFMITPCVADTLQKMSFRVINLVGRNSGPKTENNLYDLAKILKLPFLESNSGLNSSKPAGGFYIDQKDLSTSLERWVDLRREIIKRPFLATLEKFLDPGKADILITSAFHGNYGEKMAEIAEGAGFPGSIVVRNGVEGSIAFPLTRPAKLLCCARQKDGTYVQNEIVLDPVQFFGIENITEEKLDKPSLPVNADLVQHYLKTGRSPNAEFDRRVTITSAGLKQGIEWITENLTAEREE